MRLLVPIPLPEHFTQAEHNAITNSSLGKGIKFVANAQNVPYSTYRTIILYTPASDKCDFDITPNRIKNMLGNSDWKAGFRGLIDRITGWYNSRNLPECLKKSAFLREIRSALCKDDQLTSSDVSRAERNYHNTLNHFNRLKALAANDDEKERLTVKNEANFNKDRSKMTSTATFFLDDKVILKKSYTQKTPSVTAVSQDQGSSDDSDSLQTQRYR